ncbi:unnamed protein product [Pedinophyceae sp. YPF-701]|nr:unnamed protein product [Pedinophyceae sp. YPF-701]
MSNQRALSALGEEGRHAQEGGGGVGDAGGVQLSSEQARLLQQVVSQLPQNSSDSQTAQLLALLTGAQKASFAKNHSPMAPSALEQLNAALRGAVPAPAEKGAAGTQASQGRGAGDGAQGTHAVPRDGAAHVSGSGAAPERDAPSVSQNAPGDSAGKVDAEKAPRAGRKQRRGERAPSDPDASAGEGDAGFEPRKRHAPVSPVAPTINVDPSTEPRPLLGGGVCPLPGGVAEPAPPLSHDDLEALREIISHPAMVVALGPVHETMAKPPAAILRMIGDLPSHLLSHMPTAHLFALARMLPKSSQPPAAATAPPPAARLLPEPASLLATGALSSSLRGLAAPPASLGAATLPLQASHAAAASLPAVTLGSHPLAHPGLVLSAPPALPLPPPVPWPPAPAFPRSDAPPPSVLPQRVTAALNTESPASAATVSPGTSHGAGLEVPERYVENRGRVPWSKEEDDALLSVIRRFGPQNWRLIAAVLNQEMEAQLASFQPRSDRQCRQRWTNNLDTSLRRSPFSPQEDEIILREQARHGNKWAQIARALPPGRTGNQVKNHWYTRLKDVSEKRGLTRAEPVRIPPEFASLVRQAPKPSAPVDVASRPPLAIDAQQRPADGSPPPPLPSWGRKP